MNLKIILILLAIYIYIFVGIFTYINAHMISARLKGVCLQKQMHIIVEFTLYVRTYSLPVTGQGHVISS